MAALLPILSMIGAFIAGFIIAIVVQFVIVPLIVLLLGERHFASASAFDGCTLGLISGFVAAMAPPILWTSKHPIFHGSPLWVFPMLAAALTLYGLLYLWFLGMGGRGRAWKIVDGRILNRKKQELHPTFVRERSDYNQTDAFHGYSHYFLELHNDEGSLGTNAYNSEDEFKRDSKLVREITNAKRLDLVWFRRVEAKKWMFAHFPNEWALVLCGSLNRLSESDREWWHGWVYPAFAVRKGSEVDITDALHRLERLQEAYAEEIKDTDSNTSEFADRLRRLLSEEGPIIAVTNSQFHREVDKVSDKDDALSYEDDFISLVS